MRTFYLGENEYTYPDAWYELNQEQYLALVAVLIDYSEGTYTAEQARAVWFCIIAGIDPNVVLHPTRSAMISENIYRAAREFTFFFKIEYAKTINHLSIESQKLLRKRQPQELPQTPEIRWAKKLKCKYVPDSVFAAQLIPQIIVDKETFQGYKLVLNGQILSTSITAQQYIDANTIIEEFFNSNDFDLLNKLIAILYFPGIYEPDRLNEFELIFRNINPVIKQGVLLNFNALTQFLALRTKYGIMWTSIKKEKTPDITIGLNDTIYSLSKLGYGSVDELSRINLMTFLNLSLKNIIDTVNSLHENEVSIIEISNKTGLPVTSIQKLIA